MRVRTKQPDLAVCLRSRRDDYQPETAERLAAAAGQPAHRYVDARRRRRRFTADFAAATAGVDVLLAPTTRIRATPIGERTASDGHPVRTSLLALTCPFNLTGWPVVSLPAPGPGLPAGVQIIGRQLDEHGILDVARVLSR